MKALFYISIIFLLFSCTKFGRNVTIKGKVFNPVTNEPIEGIEAWFQKSTNGLPGGYKTIKKEITDANGEFEINASRAGTHYIRLGDVKGNYRLGWYENGAYTGTSVKEVDKGKVMEVEYHLVPYSYSKLIINNVNCQDSSDLLVLYRQNQLQTLDESFGWEHEGCAYWETNGYSEILMGNLFYKWEVTRGGTTQVFYDTVFYSAGEQSTYEINY